MSQKTPNQILDLNFRTADELELEIMQLSI